MVGCVILSIVAYLLSEKAMNTYSTSFRLRLNFIPPILFIKAIIRYPFVSHYIFVEPLNFGRSNTNWVIILVVLIEAYVFSRLFRSTWYMALLFSLTVNLFALLSEIMIMNLGLLAFWGPIGIIILIGVFILTFILPVFPKGYSTIALISVIIGCMGMTWKHIYDIPPQQWRVIYVLMTPLFISFGFALIFKGMISFFIMKKYNWPRAIIYANIISLSFLLVLRLFYIPNPYSSYYASPAAYLNEAGSAKEVAEKVIEIIHIKRATNMELLGLKIKHDKRVFTSMAEFDYCHWINAYCWMPHKYNPEIAKLVLENMLEEYELDPADKRYYEWVIAYFDFWGKAWEAIGAGDQKAFSHIFQAWEEWTLRNPKPKKYRGQIIGEIKQPRVLAEIQIRQIGSNIQIQSEAMNNS